MRIGVVTVGRSDWGLYLPLLRRLQAEPRYQLELFVAGAHLSADFGLTIEEIERDGFPIAARIQMLLASDTPEGIAKSMGLGVLGFAQAFAADRPDLLVVLGDRFDMYVAALAALPFTIPIAHIHGGEITEGAIDDSLRHSLTKLSHLHFVSTADHARRVIQLGEAPERVVVSGAPALDRLASFRPLSLAELSARTGRAWPERFLLVTHHPVTLEHESTATQSRALIDALHETGIPVVFTMPNADTGGRVIRAEIARFVDGHPGSIAVESLGPDGYWSALSHAAAMVGNSSSGLLEAPSFRLPVVNIGNRQRGRTRGSNVVDVGNDTAAIVAGVQRALEPSFRSRLASTDNPYFCGGAAERIIGALNAIDDPRRLTTKRFHDLPHGVP